MLDRSIAPIIDTPNSIDILPFVSDKSKNGVGIHYIDTGSHDVVRVSLIFKAGVKYQSKSFQASATINMLTEQTRSFTSQEFAEKSDFYGLYFDQTLDRDYAIVTVCALKRFLDVALEMLLESVVYPQFPEKEFKVYTSKRKQELNIERQKVNVIARELLAKALFGETHQYGKVADSIEYDNLTTDDLKEFHKNLYTSQNCFAVVSGSVDKEDIDKVKELLESLPISHNSNYTPLEPISTERLTMEKEGALQSSIRIGRLLFNRKHPDFIPMQILSVVLGGYFGSRLIKNIREDKGYTYGIFSAMVNLEETGYLAISTEVAAEYTDESIKEIFYEIERLRSEEIPQEELEMVKNVMIGEMLRVLDGPFGINDVAIENIQNETDNSYLSLMINRINEITASDLLSIAQQYLTTESFSTVIVGKI